MIHLSTSYYIVTSAFEVNPDLGQAGYTAVRSWFRAFIGTNIMHGSTSGVLDHY